jgi:hypothetical protein
VGCYRSASGELDIVGRTMPLSPACTAEVAESITVARPDHPWPEMLRRRGRARADSQSPTYGSYRRHLVQDVDRGRMEQDWQTL